MPLPDIGSSFDVYGILIKLFETVATVFIILLGVGLIGSIFYVWRFMGYWPFGKKYPIDLLVLREMGETMPEPMLMKARIKAFQVDDNEMEITENWLETQKYKGSIRLFPLFENARNISDKLRIYYMKGKTTAHNFKGNVYPTLITKYSMIKVKKFIFGKNIPLFKMLKDEKIVLTDGDNMSEPAYMGKGEDEEGNRFPIIASEFRFVTFPQSVNLAPLYDESAVPAYIRMIKINASRYDWRDWFQKYGAIVMFGVIAVIIFIQGIVNIKVMEVLQEGIEVGVTLAFEAIDLQQVPTPEPPSEVPPGR